MTHLPYNEPVTLKCTDTLLSIETFIGNFLFELKNFIFKIIRLNNHFN